MADVLNYDDVCISELDAYLFGQGTHYEIYNKMGAHVAKKDGKSGVYFAVWAPAAKDVYVIGEFNDWKAYGYDMKKISDGGIYELFIEGAKEGQMYKYLIIGQNGEAIYKADPYANAAQLRPETASIVANLNGFKWTDNAWVEAKKKEDHLKAPMSIYECHLGSWKKQEDGTEDGYINYRDIAPECLFDVIFEFLYCIFFCRSDVGHCLCPSTAPFCMTFFQEMCKLIFLRGINCKFQRVRSLFRGLN